MDPLDAVNNTVPFRVLGGGFERLVLDVYSDCRWTAELPRRDGEDAAAAPVIEERLVLAKAALGEPLQACAQINQ